MDIDQITFPPEDKKTKPWFPNGNGFLWFVETSWHYMTPRGFIEILSFLIRLPAVWLNFRKQMQEEQHSQMEYKNG